MDSTLDRARRSGPRSKPSPSVEAFVQAASQQVLGARIDFPLLCRWTAHLTILSLAVVAVLVGRSPSFAGQPGKGLTRAQAAPLSRQTSMRGVTGFLVRAAQPRTITGDGAQPAQAPAPAPASDQVAAEAQPLAIRTYTVQAGDTVVGLAQRFGITPETILSANSSLAGNPDLLQLGQEIKILPVSGALHTVASGDTLTAIAEHYKVTVAAIIEYKGNNLSEPYVLHPGDTLVVPGGVWTAPAASGMAGPGAAPAGVGKATGSFMWPTTGRLTQGPWWRHMAIDLGTPKGTPINAADAGYVLEAGWSNVGYGQYVLLDHGNGYRSLYAHMSVIIAKRGQWVKKGQKIGLVGSTGNSTGPHLHFEIYKKGVIQNPLDYLP